MNRCAASGASFRGQDGKTRTEAGTGTAHVADFTIDYRVPGNTLARFLRSNAFVRGIRGPIGSGKSTACCIEILRRAWETLPGVYDLPVAEMWTGFRPTSRDDAPLLGPTPIEGLVMATGHHRNGILLAPVTARAIGAFLLTGLLPEEARPFQPSRFAA